MPSSTLSSSLMKPLAVLGLPGMYLRYKLKKQKRQTTTKEDGHTPRSITEKELHVLKAKIDCLLSKLDADEPEMARSDEDTCVVCYSAKATMETFPCGHKVVCRKCFVRTIQVAISQRCLPLCCVVCRSRIIKLTQTCIIPGTNKSSKKCSKVPKWLKKKKHNNNCGVKEKGCHN